MPIKMAPDGAEVPATLSAVGGGRPFQRRERQIGGAGALDEVSIRLAPGGAARQGRGRGAGGKQVGRGVAKAARELRTT